MNSKHGILLTTENLKIQEQKNKNNIGKKIKALFLLIMMAFTILCTSVDDCSARETTKISSEKKAARKKAAKKSTKKSGKKNSRRKKVKKNNKKKSSKKKNSRKKKSSKKSKRKSEKKKARKKKSSKSQNYTVYTTPAKNSFKSYMSYRAVSSSSAQGKLQAKAKTDKETGIRKVDGRYCIALGSYYCSKIGTKIDLVMANGSIVKCILADQKANRDTDAKNQKTSDGSIAEFLVDMDELPSRVKTMGNVSYAAKELKGNISKIRVYK